jgi:hypothetical protein
MEIIINSNGILDEKIMRSCYDCDDCRCDCDDCGCDWDDECSGDGTKCSQD